ncbi:MAG: hypothetical protein K2X69_09050 [Silvanigrellaceae bacterium]|nr:hypothetical protein [Silvanigrellaceae bacterium]
MHPIDGSSSANGHFQDGSPTKQGTVVKADWLNTVQDEIINAIKAAGIKLNTPDNEDNMQLANAIITIVQKNIINLVSKNDLNDYAKNTDLNVYLKTADLEKTTFGNWTIACIESILSTVKYPNLPKKP